MEGERDQLVKTLVEPIAERLQGSVLFAGPHPVEEVQQMLGISGVMEEARLSVGGHYPMLVQGDRVALLVDSEMMAISSMVWGGVVLTLTEANLAENLGTHPYEWDVLGLAIKRCNANVIVKTPFTPGVAPSREMRRLQANRATQLNDLLRGPLVKAADAAGISATTRREMSRALLYPGAIAYFSALMSQVRDGDLPQNDGVAALERAFLLSGIDREKTVAVREFIQWFFEQSSGRTMANLSPEDAERFRQALDVLASMQLIHVLDGAVSWESPLVMNAIKIRSEWREGILAALENVIAAAE